MRCNVSLPTGGVTASALFYSISPQAAFVQAVVNAWCFLTCVRFSRVPKKWEYIAVSVLLLVLRVSHFSALLFYVFSTVFSAILSVYPFLHSGTGAGCIYCPQKTGTRWIEATAISYDDVFSVSVSLVLEVLPQLILPEYRLVSKSNCRLRRNDNYREERFFLKLIAANDKDQFQVVYKMRLLKEGEACVMLHPLYDTLILRNRSNVTDDTL